MSQTDHPESLAARLDEQSGIAIDELHQALDGLDGAGRVAFVRELNGRRQQTLWELADAHMEASVEQVFRDDLAPGATAIFEGRNSMAMFNLFQKRFTRPEGEAVLWGYNHQTWAWLTGPGYFVAHPQSDDGSLLFDYERLPDRTPDSWPALKPNSGFPASLVYGSMTDVVRAVSLDVLIGKAYLKGKERGQFFTLARGEII